MNISGSSSIFSTNYIPSVYGGGGSYLVDTYSAPIAVSLRKISSTSTNAIRVRRDSDNAEQDIGFNGNDLDTASLSSFVGANTGYVTKWYNQGTAGSTYDYVQGNATLQPRIVNAGTIDTKNGLNAIYFSGTKYFSSANFIDTYVKNTPHTQLVVASSDVSNDFRIAFSNWGGGNANGGELIIDRRTSVATAYTYQGDGFTGGSINQLSTDDTANVQLKLGLVTAAAVTHAWKDGVYQGTNNPGTLPNPTNLISGIGWRPWQNLRTMTGHIQECILWGTDEYSNVTDIQNDINTYYSIY